MVACCTYHIIVVTEYGNLWAWGDNTGTQIGNGGYDLSPEGQGSITNPLLLPNLPSSNSKITMALVEAGSEAGSEAGIKAEDEAWEPFRPKLIVGNNFENEKVVHIVCSKQGYMAVTDNRLLWTWGDNALPRCVGNTMDFGSRVIFNKSRIVAVAAGDEYSVIVTEKGLLYLWEDIIRTGGPAQLPERVKLYRKKTITKRQKRSVDIPIPCNLMIEDFIDLTYANAWYASIRLATEQYLPLESLTVSKQSIQQRMQSLFV